MITPAALNQTTRPTSVRHRILFLGCLVAAVSYLGRLALSAAAPAISLELGLTNVQMGYVFSAFALSYAIFEMPVGWWADRAGARRVLTQIVVAWSAFTILTGAVWSYASLLVIRFLFGAAEAGAFPILARALASWFPREARGTVNGIIWMGARIGGALAPPLAVVTAARLGWRGAFTVFGLIGWAWCIFFWKEFRDEPNLHPRVNQQEKDYIAGYSVPLKRPSAAPWSVIFRSVNLWMLFSMYFCSFYVYSFFLTWLPTYLRKEQGLSIAQTGFYSAAPLVAGAIGCILGGSFSDALIRWMRSLKWGRRLVGIAGFVIAGAAFAAAAMVRDPAAVIALLSLAALAHDLTLPVAWAACVEVGGSYGATAGGFMNTASSLSAVVVPPATAALADAFHSFNAVFISVAVVSLIGCILWLRIDPTRQLESENAQ